MIKLRFAFDDASNSNEFVAFHDLFQGDLTPLHYAAQKGHQSIARILLEDGAHVDPLSIDQTTPLMLAVEYSHKSIVDLLLRKGADMHLLDKSGADSLHRAAFVISMVFLSFLFTAAWHNNYHSRSMLFAFCLFGRMAALFSPPCFNIPQKISTVLTLMGKHHLPSRVKGGTGLQCHNC